MDNLSSSEVPFKNLYKNHGILEKRQAARRENLLKEQKALRNGLSDMNRFLAIRRERKMSSHATVNPAFTNRVQLSDWLLDKPEDIDNWFLIPCPKGQRCLVVARDGFTAAYSKKGYCFKKFRSSLPGDETLVTTITILDAVYDMKAKVFYVLDVLSYGYQEMMNCEASFRFFWRTAKLSELDVEHTRQTNTFPIIALEFFDLGNEDSLIDCLARHRMFDNAKTEIDGLLFYHKEASYTQGKTPLVGWLFPFMFEEVMGMRFINDAFNKKPDKYTNYLDFIEDFNKKYAARNIPKTMPEKTVDMEYDEERGNNETMECIQLVSPQELDE